MVKETNNKYSVRETTEFIKQMEKDLDLLNDETYGKEARIAWEASRFGVQKILSQKFSDHKVAHTEPKKFSDMNVFQLAKFFIKILRNATVRSPIFSAKHKKILFWGHPRRKITNDGYFEDLYVDPLIDRIGEKNSVVIEPPYMWGHSKPCKHNNIYYAELFLIIADIIKLTYILFSKRGVFDLSKKVDSYLTSKIGKIKGIREVIIENYKDVKAKKKSFTLLLWLLKPKKIVLVNSYSTSAKGLILAAHKFNIPTMELQHGVITPYHLGYSVNPGESLKTAPNKILLFGEYWNSTVNFGIKKENQLVLGFPYFDLERKKILNNQLKREPNQILFISQGSIGYKLSEFATKFAKVYSEEYNIIYKLHPGEFDRWKVIYPKLLDAEFKGSIKVIEDNNKSLYELFAISTWVVGVYSTAIFEAIGLGCIPVLIDVSGVEYMEPLINEGIATLISKIEDFPFSLYNQEINITNHLFADNWAERLDYVFKTIINDS